MRNRAQPLAAQPTAMTVVERATQTTIANPMPGAKGGARKQSPRELDRAESGPTRRRSPIIQPTTGVPPALRNGP